MVKVIEIMQTCLLVIYPAPLGMNIGSSGQKQTADKRVESMFKVQQEGSLLLKASSNDGEVFTSGI